MSRAKKLSMLLAVILAGLITIIVPPSWADGVTGDRYPMVQTPMTRVELMSALREGHVKVFGQLPSKNRLAMAWGQVALENGQGKLSYNHNLGNVGPGRPEQGTYFNSRDRHIYRAFDTFADGAAAYWEVIKRCKAALARFDQGNPTEAALYLQRCGYFEADLENYTKGFSSLYYYARTRVMQEEERQLGQEGQPDAGVEAARAPSSNAGSDRLVSR